MNERERKSSRIISSFWQKYSKMKKSCRDPNTVLEIVRYFVRV